MKRFLLRLAAAIVLAGLLGRCDAPISCDACEEDYKECAATCAGFKACELCKKERDQCLEECGEPNWEASCEENPVPDPEPRSRGDS
jgi:hypothetical protein